MNIAPVSRAARSVLLAAAGLMNFTCAVVGQLPPNPAASIETGGKLPVISIYDENDPTAPCDLVAILPPGFSGEVTHLDLRGDYVTLTFSSGQILQIPISDFHVDCENSARSHRPAATPSPTPTPVQPIAVSTSSDADEFAVSCDGHYAVVTGFSDSGKPVSLVDLQAHQEVSTISLSNQEGHGAAVGDDGQTVIVSFNDLPPAASGNVRRFVLQNGTLTDSGVQLAFDNSFVKDVRIAPGSHIGVAAVSENQGVGNTLLYSFDFPGLTIRDSVIIAGQTIETCPAFNCAGDRIYVRTGVGFGSDVIQGFDFDPATGMFNHMAFLTINNLSPTSTSSFGSTLTVSSDDTLLIAPEENQNRVSQFDAVTGNLVSTFTRADLTAPQGVATIPCCAVSPTPTATPSATATPTPTPCTGRCSPTPRPRPTPRARPTPRG
jgi:hypothetical protein